MHDYEITYLADPTLDEAKKDTLDESIDKIVNDIGGEISYTSPSDTPGSRRRLNFPIADQRVAWMRVMQIQLDPAKINDLQTTIKKHADILRLTVLQTPRRQEVSAAIFDAPEKPSVSPESAQAVKPSGKKVTMAEVEEKIEEALEEEVK
ncbi:MAG: hypothetical protein A3E37_04540 [Candidatus Andersenbacteria bacterium RIFCSPHIGHO2_12_FULL_46_9]|nr:MAG: hypothetical protein UW94_C0001G0007 [Parcubacteria group bacterium GW2011_GWA2_45_14]OGY35069.1 MAG: hypothetical protein A3B76_04460 [Candidatus Andersenbacteria bacterium RIFCSPHIGHO2_02_FULL_46_16]OGY37095.1 MAG: hypothetical protein A3I08_03320 [Candidatus Andersenbacteria bacterium RIFCSPLOWO2_02_FULL_46_11]OGY37516.1 MAG: hypothetical protein A3E37_04540 [Candidatus Andersenbacteria bacterium RIFCSPHIGHO2_12_FULL_46_9]OGY41050.1 MAG: hypothetical protein A3G57_04850 [Candidatus A